MIGFGKNGFRAGAGPKGPGRQVRRDAVGVGSSKRGRASIRSGLIALALLTGAAVQAGPTGEPEPELRALLKKAINESDSFPDRFNAEVWLTDMSLRLKNYAPKAMDTSTRVDFLKQLHAEANRAQISPELAMSVVQIESRFDRFALSKAGAVGYMQIMPFWLEEIGAPGDNLFHTNTNLRMGCTILRFYLDKEHGSYVRALARYNGSYGHADYPWLVLNALNRRWSPA